MTNNAIINTLQLPSTTEIWRIILFFPQLENWGFWHVEMIIAKLGPSLNPNQGLSLFPSSAQTLALTGLGWSLIGLLPHPPNWLFDGFVQEQYYFHQLQNYTI